MPWPTIPRSPPRGFSCLALLLMVIGLSSWLLRDLPRRIVAATLADRLAARVTLDSMTIEGSRNVRLVGLEITRLRDYPFVQSVHIDALEVSGTLKAVLEQHFEAVRFTGTEIRLAPAPAVTPPQSPLPVVGLLLFEPTKIHIASDDGSVFEVLAEASVQDFGGDAIGEIELRSPELDVNALTALVMQGAPPSVSSRIHHLLAEIRLQPGGVEVEASARKATVGARQALLELANPHLRTEIGKPETRVTLSANSGRIIHQQGLTPLTTPRLDASLTTTASETIEFELRPALEELETGEIRGVWDPENRRLLSLAAQLDGLDAKWLQPNLGLQGTVDLEVNGSGEQLEVRVEIALEGFTSTELDLQASQGSTLRLTGSLPFAPLSALEAPVWDGPMTIALDLPDADVRWDQVPLPHALFPLTAGFRGRLLGPTPLRLIGASDLSTAATGRLETSGDIVFESSGAQVDLSWNWQGARLEKLGELLARVGTGTVPASPGPASFTGFASATGSLRGPLKDAALSGQLSLAQVEISGKDLGLGDVELQGGRAEIDFRWAGSSRPLELSTTEATGTLLTPELPPLPVTLSGAGTSAIDGSHGEIERAILGTTELGTLSLAGQWHRKPDGLTARGSLGLEGLTLDRLQASLRVVSPSPLLEEIDLTGRVGVELAVFLEAPVLETPVPESPNLEEPVSQRSGSWRMQGPVTLTGAGFSSKDGSRVVEGLEGKWDLEAIGTTAGTTTGTTAPSKPVSSEVEISARGEVGNFLLLWGTFFGDFSELAAATEIRGRIGTTDKADKASAETAKPAWRVETALSIPGGPRAAGTLEAASESTGWRYTASLHDPDLGATHERYLAPLLADRWAAWVPAGTLEAEARGNYRVVEDAPPAWDLAGALHLADVELHSGSGQTTLEGLQLDLPFDLRRRPTPEVDFSGPSLRGRLAFARLAIRGLELPPTDTDLLVEADAVGLEKSITLKILGGEVTLEHLTANQLLRKPHLATGLRLADIRLEQVSHTLDLLPLEGDLNGHFAEARLSPDRLEIEGGGQFEIFGGTVRVHDISGENVLTRFPKLTLSADFEDLDLGRLTRRFDFGEMSGRLDGTLDDCELFGGIPVRFSARLQTVEREGVPRTLDVKAINNLTILSTGQRTNVLDRGLQRFFNSYTYERLGLTMSLRQDVLLLRGLEQRGDKELFLRGRLPFRIDVVNAQPGKTVSFQTMVQRLKSLDSGGTEADP